MSVDLLWKTVICGGALIKTHRLQSRKWGFSHRFYAALAFTVGNCRQISGEKAVCGGDSACITAKWLARWGKHPKKQKTAVQGRNLETNGNSHPRYHSGLRKKRHSGSKKPSASNAASACRPNRSSNDRLGSHKHPTSRCRLTPFAAL